MGLQSKRSVLAVCIIAIILASAGASVLLSRPRDLTLWGTVSLDKPVVGATVSIYDLQGNRLYEAKNATLSSGLFMLNVGWVGGLWGIPSDLRVTATGGTVDGEPFNGTIVRYIFGFNGSNYYPMNALTTLVADYKAEHPGISYSQAESMVESFLLIPDEIGMDYVVLTSDSSRFFFDSFQFMSEARQNGGFNQFISLLIDEIDSGDLGHSFTALGEVPGSADLFKMFMGDALGFLGSNLASGAVSAVGGKIMGWAMQKLGIDFGGDPVADELKQISSKLIEMDEKLDGIKSDIVKLSSEVAELKSALATVETNLNTRISQIASYNPISTIDNAYTDLNVYAKCRPGEVPHAVLDAWSMDVLSTTQGAAYSLTLLDNLIRGHVISSEAGMLEVMADSMIAELMKSHSSTAAYGKDWQTKVAKTFVAFTDSFQKLLFTEYRGLTIYCEASHQQNMTSSVAVYIQDVFTPRIQKQVALYIDQVEKMVISLEPRGYMEFPLMSSVPDSKAAIWQQIWNGTKLSEVPPIAELFPEADKFANQLLNGTGCFIVRVLYETSSSGNQTAITPPPMTFKSVQSSLVYAPVSSVTKSVAMPGSTLVKYYTRYNFSTIPAGTYNLLTPITMTATGISGWYPVQPFYTEGWQFSEGIRMSTSGPPYSIAPGWIEVSADSSGRNYGYWGGTWYFVG